jgi:hypothetical protein
MHKRLYKSGRRFLLVLFLLAASTSAGFAQTTAFNYQGRLTDTGTPANGTYDLQFALFDSLAGGAQVGSTQTVSSVSVNAGIFSVTLDFGASAFSGANRWLDIHARLTGTATFTTLAPRQPITATPYAVRSLNASSADTVTVNGVPSGSGNYIQNGITPQVGANLNISGNGTIGGDLTVNGSLAINTVNAQTQFSLGGQRILSAAGTNNLFGGIGAGQSNTTGFDNDFFGQGAGQQNTTGRLNSFFGTRAGFANTIGRTNAFFGWNSGAANVDGSFNAFFGTFAGNFNTSGTDNSIFGDGAGSANTTGNGNSIFGADAGRGCDLGVKVACITPTTGSDNSFFGRNAGRKTTVSNNAFFGANAGKENTTGGQNTFVGYAAGVDNQTGVFNAFLGYSAGEENTSGTSNTFVGSIAGLLNTIGNKNAFFGGSAGLLNKVGSSNTALGYAADFAFENLDHATAVGANTIVTASNRIQIGRVGVDTVAIGAFASPVIPTASVCVNSQGVFINCSSSSLRYKERVRTWIQGLNVIQQLRPVTFAWKEGHQPDLGLIAEEVAAVEPLLSTRNDKGEIEGVRYDRLNVVLINAIKQQQEQIETLVTANAALNKRLRSVETIVQKRKRVRRR